ncbi:amidohydrolase family protein [Achromobacter insuavis]
MWGSDWPHTEHRHLASYPAATQWLDDWIDDPTQRRAVLAETPLRLFQFQGEFQ